MSETEEGRCIIAGAAKRRGAWWAGAGATAWSHNRLCQPAEDHQTRSSCTYDWVSSCKRVLCGAGSSSTPCPAPSRSQHPRSHVPGPEGDPHELTEVLGVLVLLGV